MAATYTLSVIVPIYGVEKYIAQFARTLLGQTYTDVQFVFVNDGTKDRSIDILK
jgi:glycosyltransferase involved in cell wall biosynthesis